jgi:hypothetical protein
MSELNQGVGALRRAAGHAALGTAERLTPTYDRARFAAGRGWDTTRQTLTPIYEQMREGAVGTRKGRATRRKGAQHGKLRGLASLLAAGAAVGAAGAAVARRRRAQQAEWEEYDPVTGESRYMGSRYAEESQYGPRSARDRVTAGAASMADSFSSRAGRLADTLHERSESMQQQGGQMAEPSGMPPRTTEPMTGPSGTGPGTSPNPQGMGMGPGAPMRSDRRGDPALGFPEEP